MKIHILPNISRSKNNQTEKYHLLEYNQRNISLQKSRRQGGRRPSSRFLFVFQKAYIRLKQVVCSLVSIYFDSP